MGIELRAARLSLLARRALARLSRSPHPDNRRRVADPKSRRGMARRQTRQRGVNHAITQILAVGPRHIPLHRYQDEGIMLKPIRESHSESEITNAL